jgi:hypothetical protein
MTVVMVVVNRTSKEIANIRLAEKQNKKNPLISAENWSHQV